MRHLVDAEFIDNVTLTRLRAEGGTRLEEYGKQINILVKAFRLRHRQQPTEPMGIDHVPNVGG